MSDYAKHLEFVRQLRDLGARQVRLAANGVRLDVTFEGPAETDSRMPEEPGHPLTQSEPEEDDFALLNYYSSGM